VPANNIELLEAVRRLRGGNLRSVLSGSKARGGHQLCGGNV
jgi:hypothetical protein